MANIKMKTGVAGLDFGWAPGDVITIGRDVDADEAARWVGADFAEPTTEPRALKVAPSEHVPNEVAKKLRRRVERAVGEVAARVAGKPKGPPKAQKKAAPKAAGK